MPKTKTKAKSKAKTKTKAKGNCSPPKLEFGLLEQGLWPQEMSTPCFA